MATDWPALTQQAADTEASFAAFLERALRAEYEARQQCKRQTLLKLATLPAVKTLEQYVFGFALRRAAQPGRGARRAGLS